MEFKKYIALEDVDGFGIKKNDLFILNPNTGAYECRITDEEVVGEGFKAEVFVTSTVKVLPGTIVESDSRFGFLSAPDETNKVELLEETPVEEVMKEIQDTKPAVITPRVTDLKVILAFPGCKEGDTFKFCENVNMYVKQTPVDEDAYLSALLTDSFEAFTVEEVNNNFDYFQDITPRIMKTKEQIMDKIADLTEQILEITKLLVTDLSKAEATRLKKQSNIIGKVIAALEWSIGEGKGFNIE